MKILLFFFINNVTCFDQEDMADIIDYINIDPNTNTKDQNKNQENNSILQNIYNNILEKSLFIFFCHLLWTYFLIKQEINQEQDKIFTIGSISLNIIASPIVLITQENGICLLITISLISLVETGICRVLSKDTYTPTPYILQKIFYELILYSSMLTYTLKTNKKLNKNIKIL